MIEVMKTLNNDRCTNCSLESRFYDVHDVLTGIGYVARRRDDAVIVINGRFPYAVIGKLTDFYGDRAKYMLDALYEDIRDSLLDIRSTYQSFPYAIRYVKGQDDHTDTQRVIGIPLRFPMDEACSTDCVISKVYVLNDKGKTVQIFK